MAVANARCPWPGITDPIYARYHDEEWGVPHADDRRLFEKMVLEGFQSGLSWLTILKKRDAFREAFYGFDAERMAAMGEPDILRLLANAGIVRHRAKIEAAITNARAYLALRERQSLAALFWAHTTPEGRKSRRRTMAEVPAETEGSIALSKLLKRQGFVFVGPRTLYAAMQSSGMVNDHLVSCPCHKRCAELQKSFSPPKSPIATP